MLRRIIKYTLLIVVGGFMTIAGTDGMLRALTNPYFQFRADYIIITIIGHCACRIRSKLHRCS